MGLIIVRRLKHISRSTIIHGAVLGSLLYIGFALQTIGIQTTTASKSAFFTGMLVVFTPIVHYVSQHVLHLSKKSLKIGNIFGALCATLGLYLMTSPSGSGFSGGDGLTLIGALLFAGYIVYLDYASGEGDRMLLTFVQFSVCMFLSFGVAASFERMNVSWTNEFIVLLLYLTIFATIIAMAVQTRYQGDTTPTRAAVIFSIEPVLAAIFAYYIRDEMIGLLGVLGGAIIISGVLISEFSDEIPLLNRSLG